MCVCVLEVSVEKWLLVVDSASVLILQMLHLVHKAQALCWRLLELHSLKLLSTGIIWVSLQEVRHTHAYIYTHIPYINFRLNIYKHQGTKSTLFPLSSLGFSDELCVPGALDICPAISSAASAGL